MDQVERQVYQDIADEKKLRAKTSAKAKALPLPAAEVAGSDLRDLRSTLERSSSALGARLENGLASLGARVDRLEKEKAQDNAWLAQQRRAPSLNEVKVISPEEVVVVATAVVPPPPTLGDDGDDAQQQNQRRRAEEILLAAALADEIPLVKRHLEAVDTRVAALEAEPKLD
ncbi:unnamed protein product, partial [Laminaria digitata]